MLTARLWFRNGLHAKGLCKPKPNQLDSRYHCSRLLSPLDNALTLTASITYILKEDNINAPCCLRQRYC